MSVSTVESSLTGHRNHSSTIRNAAARMGCVDQTIGRPSSPGAVLVRKTSWLVALALVVGATLLSAVPAQAKPMWAPEAGATFNVPRPWGKVQQRYRIVHKVDRAIDGAPPGSTILATTYLMDRWETTTALIRACRRGVKVRVILDESIVGRPAKKLVQYLNADNRWQVSEKKTWVKVPKKKAKKAKKAKKPGRKKSGKAGRKKSSRWRKVVREVRAPANRGPCNRFTPEQRRQVTGPVVQRFRAEQTRKARARAARAAEARKVREARRASRAREAERERSTPAARKARKAREERQDRRWERMSKRERRAWKERRRVQRVAKQRRHEEQRRERRAHRAAVRERRRQRAGRELAQRKARALARARKPLGRELRLGRIRRMAGRDLFDRVSWGPDGSYVKMCDRACRSDHGAMHTKLFAFSQTGKAKNVVMVSSSNLNHGGANLGWNDMWTMRSARKTYLQSRRQHLMMTRERRSTRAGISFTADGVRTQFFPRIKGNRAKDPVLADLERIRCATKHRGRKAFSRVHVAMFWWGGKRGMALANGLVRMGKSGCHVNIIVGAPTRMVMQRLKAAARHRHVQLWDSRWDLWGDDVPDVRTHSKSVLVRGRVGRERWTSRVFAGSMNFTGGGLQFSDENTIMLRSTRAYDSYRSNWERMRRHSRRVNG
jgi:hypothetical protein